MRSAKLHLLVVLLLTASCLAAVDVELISRFPQIKQRFAEPQMGSPSGMMVGEVVGEIVVKDPIEEIEVVVPIVSTSNSELIVRQISYKMSGDVYEINGYIFEYFSTWFAINKDKRDVFYIKGSDRFNYGISFFLKKQSLYSAFYVNKDGLPGAADTTGKVYTPAEAMAFLKEYDLDKYTESQNRARELKLEEQFLSNKVLIWGKTYYSTPILLKKYWGIGVYRSTNDQIQYDLQGNGYQAVLTHKNKEANSEIRVVDPFGKTVVSYFPTEESQILSTYERDRIFSTSTYVGFGGNIYFYVAGEDFTEVFRIRRTWGNPDMYAMAINGYTKDEYGNYVDKVLGDMSADDLELLRNNIFALYGCEFKDEGLRKYFDKQVWYIAKPGLAASSISLPAERAALLERINIEEKKRGVLVSFGSTVLTLSSSSALTEPKDKNAYHPVKLLDSDPKTMWIENAKGPGLGENVTISFEKPVTIDEIKFEPGCFWADYWKQNNRVKQMTVKLDDKTYTVNFTDKMETQSMKLPSATTFTTATFTIKAVYPTTKWDDTAISGIEFYSKGAKIELDYSKYKEFLTKAP